MLARSHMLQPYIHGAAIIALGVVIPLIVLFQAYIGLQNLAREVRQEENMATLVENFSSVRKQSLTSDDYLLFSLMYSEHANQKTMINKQILKVSIMQLGFAVISVGMMFIVLGIRDGGADGGGGVAGYTFNFKVGSTGVLMILLGSAMATAGAVFRNEYKVVPIPPFSYSTASAVRQVEASDLYKECQQLPDESDRDKCVVHFFRQINLGER